jgi:hypothetical protein
MELIAHVAETTTLAVEHESPRTARGERDTRRASLFRCRVQQRRQPSASGVDRVGRKRRLRDGAAAARRRRRWAADTGGVPARAGLQLRGLCRRVHGRHGGATLVRPATGLRAEPSHPVGRHAVRRHGRRRRAVLRQALRQDGRLRRRSDVSYGLCLRVAAHSHRRRRPGVHRPIDGSAASVQPTGRLHGHSGLYVHGLRMRLAMHPLSAMVHVGVGRPCGLWAG